jgi:hypothetical protein
MSGRRFSGMKLSLMLLLAIVCGCSQTSQVLQPQIIHTLADTIDFGTSPLWREADTTVWVKLTNNAPITSVAISDSDFGLLDTAQHGDSIRISLSYQPESLSNHSGQCLLVSKQDTLARITLLGATSPFERRVGDSYVFSDSLGRIDSVWVSKLPFTFGDSTLGWSGIAYALGTAVDSNGDWLYVRTCGELIQVTVPLRSHSPYSNSYNGPFRIQPPDNFDGSSNCQYLRDSTMTFENFKLKSSLYRAGCSYTITGPFYPSSCSGWLQMLYCEEIGFIVSFQNSTCEGASDIHLLRFHLRR